MSSDNSVEIIGLDNVQISSPDISRIFVSETDPANQDVTLNDGQDVWIEAQGTTSGGTGTSSGSTEDQLESAFHTVTNEHRESEGLDPFSYRDDVAAVARAHSQNMFEQDDLSHVLDGSDVGDRLDEAGISYSGAAENLAYQSTDPIDGTQGQLRSIAESFVDSWLGSSGHRENIESDLESEGVGVYIDETENIVWATAVMMTE